MWWGEGCSFYYSSDKYKPKIICVSSLVFTKLSNVCKLNDIVDLQSYIGIVKFNCLSNVLDHHLCKFEI